MQAIGSIMTFVVNRILLDVSATAVAFFGIYYKLQNFLMMPINGLGQAAIPIVGYNYGDKNYQRVQQTWKILLPTGAIIALCGTVIFCCFPRTAAAVIFCQPGNADFWYSGIEDYFRFFCYGCNHDPVRLFFLWT